MLHFWWERLELRKEFIRPHSAAENVADLVTSCTELLYRC